MCAYLVDSRSDEEVLAWPASNGEFFDGFEVSQLIAAIDLERWGLVDQILDRIDFPESSIFASSFGAALESESPESLRVVETLIKR